MVLGDWGTTPTSKKCILCVQMHCLPISEMSNVGADIAKKISNLMVLITDELLRKRGWIMDKNLDNDEKFYRLPKRLFIEEQFQNMTGAAKLLYMILLDRRCLSELNGDAWRDEYGVVFIFFTIEEIMKLMHLGNKKINKMLKELEQHGLIYRRHQGLGRPNKIYVYDLLKTDNSNWIPKKFLEDKRWAG